MDNSKIFEQQGILEEMSQGVSKIGEGGEQSTELKYIRFNGKKYGPVIYDAKIDAAMSVNNKMSLVMYKGNGKWMVMAIKLANGKTYGADLSYGKKMVIMGSFSLLFIALLFLTIPWGFAINLLDLTFTFGAVGYGLTCLGLWAGFLYIKLKQMNLLIQLSHTFGEDKIH